MARSVRVAMEGLDALRAGLKALPAELNQKARGRVIGTANEAADKLRAAYPRGDTGNLRAGVKVKVEENTASTVATVRSTSAHAHLWEFGTQVRRTQKGFNRGAMPAAYDKGLVGIARRERRELQEELIDIVREAGFAVSETP